MPYYAGIDLGGTKSAACIAEIRGGDIRILKKSKFPTIDHSSMFSTVVFPAPEGPTMMQNSPSSTKKLM